MQELVKLRRSQVGCLLNNIVSSVCIYFLVTVQKFLVSKEHEARSDRKANLVELLLKICMKVCSTWHPINQPA